MRAVVQRVLSSKLYIDGKIYSEIGNGLLILLAVSENDSEKDLDYIFNKTLKLRIFNDENDKMNLPIQDIDGDVMIVSQFTLYGDVRKGYRPSFTESAKGDFAKDLYNKFVDKFKSEIKNTKTGVFGADMKIELINDGPVTIQLDSNKIY